MLWQVEVLQDKKELRRIGVSQRGLLGFLGQGTKLRQNQMAEDSNDEWQVRRSQINSGQGRPRIPRPKTLNLFLYQEGMEITAF